MRKHILTYSILFSINSVMVSCQSKTQNKETNTSVNLLKMKEQFPNQNTAFEKTNDKVTFYKPSGSRILTIDLKKHFYYVYSSEIYHEGFIKVNDMLYFFPGKIEKYQTFSTGETGTGNGTFKTQNVTNDLGLPLKETIEYPDENKVKTFDVSYGYNKFGQLLKVQQDNKTIVDKTYDNNGNLIESKTPDEHIKYNYNKEGNVVSEEVEKKGQKKIFNYQYNSSKQLLKKYTDDQNQVQKFTYDSEGKILSIVEYYGEIDKSNANKLINHFLIKTYSYTKNQPTEENHREFKIANASVLVNKKWQAINLEKQRKLAWDNINNSSEIPIAENDKKYVYLSNEINVSINYFSFSNRVKNGKASQEKEILRTESIKFSLDKEGRIIKKETVSKDDQKSNIEKYFY